MNPIKVFSSFAVPLRGRNIDTDQIIPARFLKMDRQAKGGYGTYLFYDAVHDKDGVLNKTFILNQPEYEGATILIAEQNFGCGSSREGAVYAFVDKGFQAVIAPSFGDIFFNNCLKNGLLPVRLPEDVIANLLDFAVKSAKGLKIDVNLESLEICWTDGNGERVTQAFDLDPFWRECLLKGVDEIELTMTYLSRIEQFEKNHYKKYTWLDAN